MDSGWIQALKELPNKITGGICVSSIMIFILHGAGKLELDDIGKWVSPLVVIVGVVSGCLFVSSIFSSWLKFFSEKLNVIKFKKLEVIENKKILNYLDGLSERELYMICHAIRGGSSSFCWSSQASEKAQLESKGLLYSVPGYYKTHSWPLIFHDFVWEEIQQRKEELLEREKHTRAKK